MVFGNIFKRLIGGGGGASSDESGQYYYVRCAKCGEVVRVRVDRSNDLAQEFDDEGDNPTGYVASKGVVGKKCFRVMSLTIKYDRARREVNRSVDGGEFVTAEEYESAAAAEAEGSRSA